MSRQQQQNSKYATPQGVRVQPPYGVSPSTPPSAQQSRYNTGTDALAARYSTAARVNSDQQYGYSSSFVGNSAAQGGLWGTLMERTSGDGFTHGKPRKLSPKAQKVNTRGHWDTLMQRTSQDGFVAASAQRNKRCNLAQPGHFERGAMIVQINDEGGLFNRKPLIKHNREHRESHVFDAFRHKIDETDRQRFQDDANPQYLKSYKSEYSKYYPVEEDRPATAAVKSSVNVPKKSEYSTSFLHTENNPSNDWKKVKPRKALPKPSYLQEFLKYKQQHDALPLN